MHEIAIIYPSCLLNRDLVSCLSHYFFWSKARRIAANIAKLLPTRKGVKVSPSYFSDADYRLLPCDKGTNQ
jgi:hypothetical protein